MSVRRSQAPEPIVATTSGPKTAKTPSARRYNRRARRLIARFKKEVPAHVREFLLKSYAREVAVRRGQKHSPAEYAHGFLSALEKFAPQILAGVLPGYGPMRACFGLELVCEVAPVIEGLEQKRRETRDARRSHNAAVGLTDAQRLDAQVALACVVGGDPDAAERIAETAPRSRSARGRIESAENLALEAMRAVEEVPVELLDDAGLTAEALDGLQTTTAQADDAAHARAETEAAARAARAQLAEPCGRILHELKTLLQAARRARTKDATVPTFRTKLVSPSKPTATEDEDEAATPAPVPTPAPEEPPATKPA